MENEVIKKHVGAIVTATFNSLKFIYEHHQENGPKDPRFGVSRLVFPKYSDDTTRLSEQELRFLFVEKFNQYCHLHGLSWYYSVETPTKYKYIFSDHNNKIEPRMDEDGQSAMVDLAIHKDDDLKRIALIEFKALNPNASCFDKDFVKLENEPADLTFFIMYVKSHDNGTIDSLKLKIGKKSENTEFICYDLTKGEEIQKEILRK